MDEVQNAASIIQITLFPWLFRESRCHQHKAEMLPTVRCSWKERAGRVASFPRLDFAERSFVRHFLLLYLSLSRCALDRALQAPKRRSQVPSSLDRYMRCDAMRRNAMRYNAMRCSFRATHVIAGSQVQLDARALSCYNYFDKPDDRSAIGKTRTKKHIHYIFRSHSQSEKPDKTEKPDKIQKLRKARKIPESKSKRALPIEQTTSMITDGLFVASPASHTSTRTGKQDGSLCDTNLNSDR